MTAPASVRDPQSEAELIAFLRGDPCHPASPVSFAHMAVRHRVAPLLVKARVSSWIPPEQAAQLVAEARRQAIVGELRDRRLREALEALDDAGVRVLVMKGSHLAHVCYPESYLRPRDDSDLLIRAADCDRATAALAAIGYRLEAGMTNRHALGQVPFDRPDAPGALLDVHWRVAAPLAAASLFDVDELLARAVPLPQLGAAALGPALADALALACVHQAAHHPGHDMLLWTYDIHLLLSSFGDADAAAFMRFARSHRIARVCLEAVEPASRSFPSSRASTIVEQLREVAAAEPPSPLLQPRRKIDDLRFDLGTLGWRDGARLVVAHLFPPAAYMRGTYAPGSRAWLPWLYLARVIRGASKWFR